MTLLALVLVWILLGLAVTLGLGADGNRSDWGTPGRRL